MSDRTESSVFDTRPGELAKSTVPGVRERLVVVGFGMVGYRLIDRLSKLSALDRFEVIVIGEEPRPAYDRVRLTEWLDHRDTQRLALGRAAPYDSMGIRVITGTRVVSRDRERQLVETVDAEEIGYDRLVLATGSAPFVPPIGGTHLNGVFVYRTIDDLSRIATRAAAASTAVVVGGGLLGIELVAVLRRMGPRIVLLESGPCPFEPSTRSGRSSAAGNADARIGRADHRRCAHRPD